MDLSSGEIRTEPLCEDVAWEFLGGRGAGTKYFYDEIDPTVDAFSDSNQFQIWTGPLTGTFAPTGARWSVTTKSPLTGTIGYANSGGSFGAELKFAGYDALIVEGKSPRPVYLWIENDLVELRPADQLWGRKTGETDDLLRMETHPNMKAAYIGPAGENKCLMAAVMNDKERAAGRNGVGAVMGDKKLKAIAVRGTRQFGLADIAGFRKAVRDAMFILKSDETTGDALTRYGTAGSIPLINASGLFPTRNFQTGVMPTAPALGGEAIAEKVLVRNKGCFACSIACGRDAKIRDGKYAGASGRGPEYQGSGSLGGATGVDDLNTVTMANFLCNELGLDPISAGATIACAMEMVEKGWLSGPDATVAFDGDEHPLEFGSGDALIGAIHSIAYRRGIGDELANGSYRFAERRGHPEISMTVKKQELPAYDPRGAKGMALTYGTSPRGACHLKSYTVDPEILRAVIDPLTEEGKALLAKTMQDTTAVVDSTGLCLFTTSAMAVDDYPQLINTAIGGGMSSDDMLLIGERIFNLERLFNNEAGFTADDDAIPARLTDEPMPEGPAKGHVVDYNPMLSEYYRLRGWDSQGRPTNETMKRLGINQSS